MIFGPRMASTSVFLNKILLEHIYSHLSIYLIHNNERVEWLQYRVNGPLQKKFTEL
jgi:hypothetical protein